VTDLGLSQSSRLRSILSNLHLSHRITPVDHLAHDLIALAHQLDENLLQTIISHQTFDSAKFLSASTQSIIEKLTNFFSLPELHKKQVKFSRLPLTHQLLTPFNHERHSPSPNYFSSLEEDVDFDLDTMELDDDTNPAPNPHQYHGQQTLALQRLLATSSPN
jgi:hypothetical protein